jgi:hypothetical protein
LTSKDYHLVAFDNLIQVKKSRSCERGEPEPELVGAQAFGRGAIGEQVALAFLDPVLHLAASAVDLLIWRPTDAGRRTHKAATGAGGAKRDEWVAAAAPPRPGVSKLSIDRTVTLTAAAQPGSRHKGYEQIIVQDIAFKPQVTL